jgi:hypothetical protein
MEIKKCIFALFLLLIGNSCSLKKSVMDKKVIDFHIHIEDPRIINFNFEINPLFENILSQIHIHVRESMGTFNSSDLVEFIYPFEHFEYDGYGNKLNSPNCGFMVVYYEKNKKDGYKLTLEYLKKIEEDLFLQKTISAVHVISQ